MTAAQSIKSSRIIALAGIILAISGACTAASQTPKPTPHGPPDPGRGFFDCDLNGQQDNADRIEDLAKIPSIGVLGQPGQFYNFRTCGSNFDTVLAVFDSNGILLATNDDACGLQSNIDLFLEAGEYTVLAAGFPALFSNGPSVLVPECPAAGTLVLNLDGSEFDPFILPSGRLAARKFRVGGDCDGNGTPDELEIPGLDEAIDLGTFTAAVPGINLPDLFRTCGSDFDTRIAIFDPFGNVISFGDNNCGQQGVAGGFLGQGQHFIAVGGAGASFSNGFGISLDGSGPCTPGGELVLDRNGSPLFSGPLGSGRIQLFRFMSVLPDCDGDGIPDTQEFDCDQNGIPDDCEVPAADDAVDLGTVIATAGLARIQTCVGTNFHTDIALFDSDGNLIAEDDQSCESRSDILGQLPDGEYYVAVSGSDTFYADGLTILPNFQGCAPGGTYELRINQATITGTLASGRVQLYRFTLLGDCNGDGTPDSQELDCDGDGIADICQIPSPQAAEQIGVICNETDPIEIHTFGSDFDTEIAVFDSAGELVATNDDAANTLQSQLVLDLTQGTYYVSFSGFNIAFAGNFGIRPLGCTDSGNLLADLNGVPLAGTLGSGRVRLIRFEIAEAPNCPADLAAPFGSLNFFDLAAYLALFNSGDPAADLAPPLGTLNFFDLAGYLASFNAGCP
jgi:hypothetical protein